VAWVPARLGDLSPEAIAGHLGDFGGIEALLDDAQHHRVVEALLDDAQHHRVVGPGPFRVRRFEFGKVLRDQMVSDPQPHGMFLLFQTRPGAHETSQFAQLRGGVVGKQATGLPHQVGDVGRIVHVVLVPAPVEQLAVARHRHVRDQYRLFAGADQELQKGLMVDAGGLEAKHALGQFVLQLQVSRQTHQRFEPGAVVAEDETLAQRLSGGRAKKGVMALLGDVDADQQNLGRTADFRAQGAKDLEPVLVAVHRIRVHGLRPSTKRVIVGSALVPGRGRPGSGGLSGGVRPNGALRRRRWGG
jgi:hypothetical protein